MARARNQPARPAGEPAGRRERPGKAKVTMWLDEEVARKLRALRGWEDRELGDIAGPILAAALSSWYVAERGRSARPAVRIAPPPGDDARPAGGGDGGEAS
jgi:hypothetical protein